MAFNAAEFRSKIKNGGARPNNYEVTITFPDAGAAAETFKFTCRAASVPGMTIGSVDLAYFGRRVSFAGDRVFDDWNVRVYCGEDMVVRNAFERWSDRLSRLDISTTTHADIAGTAVYSEAKVKLLGKEGEVLKTYTLKNVWPVNVGTVELAWDANDQILEFDATLRLDYFVTDKISARSATA